MGLVAHLGRGAVAGAAGTTALNAVTYLDMVARGRGTSSTPERTVETLERLAPVTIPGQGETRESRVAGLGALNGIASGVGIGCAFGLLHAAGWRQDTLRTGVLAGLAAMALTDGTMSALGVTDPRTWSLTDWASDVVPHLAYGVVTAATLAATDSD